MNSTQRKRWRNFKFIGGPLDERVLELEPDAEMYLYREGLRKFLYKRRDVRSREGLEISEFHITHKTRA